jgi:glycosyltransferase involved in cell wall biosynthesis
LCRAVASALAQTVPVEVIVIDDGSTDGTADLVQRTFPGVRLLRREESRGYIVRRNEGAELATGDVLFSLDDDAEFTSGQTVAQTLREFDDRRIGAVAIPYVEPNKDGEVRQRAPAAAGTWVTDVYVGTAHAVCRKVFLEVGGYREELVHQGEERDFCLRLLRSGYVVRLGRADVIHHYESPKRDMRRMDYYGRRNDILFAWHCVPMPFLPLHLAGTTLNGLRSAWRSRRPLYMAWGLLSGYAGCLRGWKERSPVPAAVYSLHRRLKMAGPGRLDEIEEQLPTLVGDNPRAPKASTAAKEVGRS